MNISIASWRSIPLLSLNEFKRVTVSSGKQCFIVAFIAFISLLLCTCIQHRDDLSNFSLHIPDCLHHNIAIIRQVRKHAQHSGFMQHQGSYFKIIDAAPTLLELIDVEAALRSLAQYILLCRDPVP